jgi:hypothetical protein
MISVGQALSSVYGLSPEPMQIWAKCILVTRIHVSLHSRTKVFPRVTDHFKMHHL